MKINKKIKYSIASFSILAIGAASIATVISCSNDSNKSNKQNTTMSQQEANSEWTNQWDNYSTTVKQQDIINAFNNYVSSLNISNQSFKPSDTSTTLVSEDSNTSNILYTQSASQLTSSDFDFTNFSTNQIFNVNISITIKYFLSNEPSTIIQTVNKTEVFSNVKVSPSLISSNTSSNSSTTTFNTSLQLQQGTITTTYKYTANSDLQNYSELNNYLQNLKANTSSITISSSNSSSYNWKVGDQTYDVANTNLQQFTPYNTSLNLYTNVPNGTLQTITSNNSTAYLNSISISGNFQVEQATKNNYFGAFIAKSGLTYQEFTSFSNEILSVFAKQNSNLLQTLTENILKSIGCIYVSNGLLNAFNEPSETKFQQIEKSGQHEFNLFPVQLQPWDDSNYSYSLYIFSMNKNFELNNNETENEVLQNVPKIESLSEVSNFKINITQENNWGNFQSTSTNSSFSPTNNFNITGQLELNNLNGKYYSFIISSYPVIFGHNIFDDSNISENSFSEKNCFEITSNSFKTDINYSISNKLFFQNEIWPNNENYYVILLVANSISDLNNGIYSLYQNIQSVNLNLPTVSYDGASSLQLNSQDIINSSRNNGIQLTTSNSNVIKFNNLIDSNEISIGFSLFQKNDGNLNYTQELYIQNDLQITNSEINLDNLYIKYFNGNNDGSNNIQGQYYLEINIFYTSSSFNFIIQVPNLVINID